MQIEWWHWIMAGFCLIGMDLIIPSFAIIWFGLGALMAGVFYCFCPGFPLVGQVLLWLLVSSSFMAMWFKYLKPMVGLTGAGKLKEDIVGESGVIIRGTNDCDGRGVVEFSVSAPCEPKLGCYSSEALHVGDRVRVVDVEGENLQVEVI